MDKKKLREKLKIKREKLHQNLAFDKQINAKLMEILKPASYQSILFYYPIFSEVNVLSTLKYFISQKNCLLPRIRNNKLEAVLVMDLENSLAPDSCHILAPIGSPYTGSIDAVLVPGLGFNKTKHRLGYGRGFYDRYLKEHQGQKIGCFYFGLLSPFIPETHDISLDIIITEEGLF